MEPDPSPAQNQRLRSFAERRLGATLALEAGWPSLVAQGKRSEWTRGAGVWLHLEAFATPGIASALWMEAGLALELVDRALGGEGGLTAPSAHPGSRLSDAERGVLAFVVARALGETGLPYRLCGIDAGPPSGDGDSDEWVCWPAQIRLGGCQGAARFWGLPLPSALRANTAAPPLSSRWVLAAEPLEPGPLSHGEVVVLEAGGRHARDGWLRVGDFECLLPVRRRAGALHARPGRAPAEQDARLEVQGPEMPLDGWAALAEGEPLAYPLEAAHAWLMRSGELLASGPLVELDGRLGLRIDQLGA